MMVEKAMVKANYGRTVGAVLDHRTFAIMYAFGFSDQRVVAFGLVLAIGIVAMMSILWWKNVERT